MQMKNNFNKLTGLCVSIFSIPPYNLLPKAQSPVFFSNKGENRG
jgi:hypothetical protein